MGNAQSGERRIYCLDAEEPDHGDNQISVSQDGTERAPLPGHVVGWTGDRRRFVEWYQIRSDAVHRVCALQFLRRRIQEFFPAEDSFERDAGEARAGEQPSVPWLHRTLLQHDSRRSEWIC